MTPRGIVIALALGTVAAGSGLAQASPAALANKAVPGIQSYVGCLSAKLCVLAGYTNKGVGDIVPVKNGAPQRAQTVKGTQGMYGVSCPNPSGCVALARPSSDVGVIFVKIGSSGKVTGSKKISVPAGVTINRLACTKLTSCTVTGTDIFVSLATIEVGSWNGSKLTLHRTSTPKNTDAVAEAVSCAGTACDAVGWYSKGAANTGFSLTISGGKPGKLHTVKNDTLTGVSCLSKSLCYASGYKATGGLVMKLASGVPSPLLSVTGDLMAIGCHASACTAVGEQLPPPSSGDAFWGTIVGVASGHGSSQTDSASGGYTDVARVGTFFAAIGPAQHGGSEVTTG